MSDLQKWIVSLVLTAALIFVSYRWLDRPIALIAHHYVRHIEVFGWIIYRVPEFVAPLAGLALIVVAARVLMKYPVSRLQTVVLLCGLSFFVAEGIKTYLKVAFGRTWPETMFNNPSFIRDGVYGFFPFHGGFGYSAFPSGHITALCSIISVLWICYPKFRPVYILCALAVAVGLVGANYHFLGDVIAGAYLGASTGWIATRMWRARALAFTEAEMPPAQPEGSGHPEAINAELPEPVG
jgi:membrane-associated phospholipid phosphatase